MSAEWPALVASIAWFLFFCLFSEVITVFSENILRKNTKYYKELSEKDRLLFNNHFTSLLHSSLSSVGVIYACYHHYQQQRLFKDPLESPSFFQQLFYVVQSFTYDDPINDSVPGYYFFFPLSIGYFFYDFVALYIWHKLLPWGSFDQAAHHLACVIGGFISIQFLQCQPYLFTGLIAELNTVFLHTRKLMKFLNWDKDRSFFTAAPSTKGKRVLKKSETESEEFFRLLGWTINWFIMFSSLIMFRIIAHTYGTLSVINNLSRFTIWVLPFAIFCCVMIQIINFRFLYILIKVDGPGILQFFGYTDIKKQLSEPKIPTLVPLPQDFSSKKTK